MRDRPAPTTFAWRAGLALTHLAGASRARPRSAELHDRHALGVGDREASVPDVDGERRAVDLDDFRSAIDEGVAAMQKAGADVVLMNLQYSPRTETMISTSAYLDNMRVVAQQYDVPLFDRFAIMRQWNESGDFDLFSASPGIGLAKRVHDCLGRALSTFVIDAAHISRAELRVQH